MPIELDPRPKTISDETTPTEPRRAIPARGVAVIVVTAMLAAVPFIGAGDTQDGSHAFAESQRMQSLVPVADVVVDTSHETAEFRRFERLATRVDNSHEVAEAQRMQSLVPVADVVVDTSHEIAEFSRFESLAPRVDISHEVVESQRMQSLAPTADVVVDMSHETAETRRMLTLQP